MTQQDVYSRPPAQYEAIDEGWSVLTVRASAVTDCQRKLYYSASSVPESDEVPVGSRNVMQLGQTLEPEVLRRMQDLGWEFLDEPITDLFHAYFSDHIRVSGVIDAYGLPPQQEGHPHEWCVVEVKTHNANAFLQIRQYGNYIAQPAAVAQLAMYRQMAILMDDIPAEAECVIASMNRDNGELHIEPFRPEVLDEVAREIARSWDNSQHERFQSSEVPPPGYVVDDYHCLSCEWRSHCGNVSQPVEPQEASAGDPAELEAVVAAFREWETAQQIAEQYKVPEHLEKQAKQLAMNYMQRFNERSIDIRGSSGQNYTVSLSERKSVEVDKDQVRFLLNPEQWQQVIQEKYTRPFVSFRKNRS